MKALKISLSAVLSVIFAFTVFAVPAAADVYYSNGVFTFSINGKDTIAIHSYDKQDGDVVIPEQIFNDTVTGIEKNAFIGNEYIESVKLPDTLTSIGSYAFYSVKNLVSIEIPDGCSVGNGAFRECVSLKSATVGEGIQTIEALTFYGCESLEAFSVPSTVTSIERLAFAECSTLCSVTIPESVTFIHSNAFNGCPNLMIYGYENSYAQQYAAENNISFTALKKYDLGDVNRDDKVSINDATCIQKFIAEAICFDAEQEKLADFNGDKKININDVTAVQRFIAGINE